MNTFRKDPMQWIPFVLILAAILCQCTTNKLTGKKQLSLVSNQQLSQLSVQEYSKFLQQSKVLKGTKDALMVETVGRDVTRAIAQYYTDKGLAKALESFKWEYNLVESKEVNAWCMPGGKIAVYTGLLPITQNINALAVVMGHEIAHAIAEHGKERASSQMLQQAGLAAVAVGTMNKSEAERQTWLAAYGIGSSLGVILPFSRNQELEADRLGLMYAALAGYDPQEAIPLWRRMGSAGGGKPPEFASTHPSDETRIAELQKMMPQAMEYYRKAKGAAK